MDFTPINTQEEFDAAIKDRLDRERKTAEKRAAEQYKDYDSIKNSLAEAQGKLEKSAEQSKSLEEQIKGLTAKVHKYETDSEKTAIALAKGLPPEAASRLHGETKEELEADADNLVKLFGVTKRAQPLYNPEGTSGDLHNAALKQLLAGMKK